jgi:hypothetical protein
MRVKRRKFRCVLEGENPLVGRNFFEKIAGQGGFSGSGGAANENRIPGLHGLSESFVERRVFPAGTPGDAAVFGIVL